MEQLTFTKMHGLGNDFMVVDCRHQPFPLTGEQISRLADRHFGVGFDQLLVITHPESSEADIGYRIYNSDGGEVAQCGNGARCIAEYLYERNILRKDEIIAETLEGLLRLYRQPDGQIRVNMGIPRFQPGEIPMSVGKQQAQYTASIAGHDIQFSALSLGNPHAVLQVEDTDTAEVGTLGPALQQADLFPESVNVGFMQVIDPQHIKLRVYERGAGETLACGSGAAAAVVAGIQAGELENSVEVSLQGGDLLVSWAGVGEPVWMTGPATVVYEGRMML